MRRLTQLAATMPLAALILSGAPAHARPAPNVAGSWQTIVPVTLTSYQPSSDPTTGTYAGVGTTEWQGTLTGVTHYKIHGTANLITGVGSGAIDETFIGRSVNGETGTMRFTETYVLDDAGHIRIEASLVDATGEFAGSRATLAFAGTEYGAATGNGTYSGTWRQDQ